MEAGFNINRAIQCYEEAARKNNIDAILNLG